MSALEPEMGDAGSELRAHYSDSAAPPKSYGQTIVSQVDAAELSAALAALSPGDRARILAEIESAGTALAE